MIRLIQRRLIIPRGDTGTFTVPALSPGQSDSVGVFTIFDPITKTRVFQKQVELQDGIFNIEFNHGDTVNLQAGDYLWDIKFYINPIIENGKVIDGTEIDSYYAAFSTPKCEIRETGDDFMVIDGQPAKIEDLNIILAATEAANAAKIAATEKAEEAAARLAEMVAAIPTKVSELENDSGYLQEETDPTVPAWAKAQTKPSYTPQEVGALPADTFIPSKVSDLTDDSGHYIKPATGIPASDLEETYLTQHQDISMKANSADLAAVATSGDYSDLANTPYIPTKTSDLVNDSNYPVDASYVHTDNNYTTAEKEKLAGIAVGAEVNVNADWNAASGDAQILNKPTQVSAFTNDVGYLTEHQDISGKANSADLAAVATSGSYNDLEDKPFIPSKASDLTDDSGHYTKPAGGIPASDLAETYLTAHQDISGKADKSEIPTKVSQLQNDSGYLASFTETDPTVPAWAKAAQKPSYTAAEVGAPTVAEMNTAIGNAIGNINSFDMAVVQALPEQDISTHTIYLVPKTGETNDVYDEYVYINNAWEMVGNTQVDLSNYVQKTDYATSNDAGIVKVGLNSGLIAAADGSIVVAGSVDSTIKPGTNARNPITPKYQHVSTFYGLAKAAGDTTQSASDNPVGTYTDNAKTAIKTMLGVTDDVTNLKSTIGDTENIIAPQYDDLVFPVTKNSYCIHNGELYYAKNNISESEAWDSSHWGKTEIGNVLYDHASGIVTAYTTATSKYTKPTTGIPASDLASGVIPSVPVTDVQVAGTSVLSQGVANVPLMDATTPGVAKLGDSNGLYGLIMSSGMLMVNPADDYAMKTGSGKRKPITSEVQHKSAFYGLAKAAGDSTQSASGNTVGTYTESAKSAISQMLDAPETVSGTTPSITGKSGIRYVCGEVATLSITPPASGDMEVIFTSGSTATVLTVPNTVKFPEWFDATALEANRIYDIIITNATYGVVTSWAS